MKRRAWKEMRAGLALLAACVSFADEPAKAPANRPTYRITKATSEIHVDGVLDEAAWDAALKLDLAYETNPGENTAPPVRTEMRLTYDESNLYAAFHAFDPDPASIRAHISDRDRAFSDDFVGVALDTFNDGRRAFEFFVNPHGVQMDLTQNDIGGSEDDSWDAIWNSAAKIVEDGYIVEFSVPFSSLRFPKTSGELTWGFDALRIYPRNARHRIGVHPLDRNISCYLCQASRLEGFAGITPGRNLEIAPTLTTHRSDERADFPNGALDGGKFKGDAGLTARWGITPNVSLNAAINPDFSQVEADSGQLDINTTFALFYSEKRPFFLEGADFFQTPLNAVYTRNIADPSWGLKLTGKQGRSAVGVFAARDERSNLLIPGSQGSDLATLDRDDHPEGSTSSVVRYRSDFGKSSAIGMLFTDREGKGYHNRVLGVDGLYRFTDANRFRFQVLGSQTRYPNSIVEGYAQPEGDFTSFATRLAVGRSTRNWDVYAIYYDVGKDFRADLGFMPQVDYRQAQLGGEHYWLGGKDDWYTRVTVGAEFNQISQHDGTLLNRSGYAWASVGGPLQSWTSLNLSLRERSYNGKTFQGVTISPYIEANPSGNFEFYLSTAFGHAIDYANTRPATQILLDPGVKLRLGSNLEMRLAHTLQQLNVDGGRLFLANLSQFRLIYQFSVRAFARIILQYTDITRDPSLYTDATDKKTRGLDNQLLFAYKLNPQTVLFLGYSDGYAGATDVSLTQTDRTFFLKLGYAWTL